MGDGKFGGLTNPNDNRIPKPGQPKFLPYGVCPPKQVNGEVGCREIYTWWEKCKGPVKKSKLGRGIEPMDGVDPNERGGNQGAPEKVAVYGVVCTRMATGKGFHGKADGDNCEKTMFGGESE